MRLIIPDYFALENNLKDSKFIFDVNESLENVESALDISEFRTSLESFKGVFNSQEFEKLVSLVGVPGAKIENLTDYENLIRFLNTAQESIVKLREIFKDDLNSINQFLSFNQSNLTKIQKYIKDYEDNKFFLVGFFLSREKVAELDLKFKQDFETTFISPHKEFNQIKKASEIVKKAGAICVKTATSSDPLGFSELSEKAKHVRIMKESAPGLLIKASGGIRTLADVKMMIEDGADIIGTSSGVEIVNDYDL